MNTKQNQSFEERLTSIEKQLKSLQETKEILVKSPADEKKALALNELFRQKLLDELKILEINIKLAQSRKIFWMF